MLFAEARVWSGTILHSKPYELMAGLLPRSQRQLFPHLPTLIFKSAFPNFASRLILLPFPCLFLLRPLPVQELKSVAWLSQGIPGHGNMLSPCIQK